MLAFVSDWHLEGQDMTGRVRLGLMGASAWAKLLRDYDVRRPADP